MRGTHVYMARLTPFLLYASFVWAVKNDRHLAPIYLANNNRATLHILDKIVHAILHRINHPQEKVPCPVNAPGGRAVSLSAGSKSSKSNLLRRWHGVCVSDIGNVLGQLQEEAVDIDLETGWEGGAFSCETSTVDLNVDLSDESGDSKAAPEEACKADIDPDVAFGKTLYKVEHTNGRVTKTVESFNDSCGSS